MYTLYRHGDRLQTGTDTYASYRHGDRLQTGTDMYTLYRHGDRLQAGTDMYTLYRHGDRLQAGTDMYALCRHGDRLQAGTDMYALYRHGDRLQAGTDTNLGLVFCSKQEYADNLLNSGVHGAVLVLEPTFNSEAMATALGIPSNKHIIRRHLFEELSLIVNPA
eukprot:g46241.t1